MKKICHLTTAHSRNDIRIFIKELTSLADSDLSLDCGLIVADAGHEQKINNVSIHSIGRPKSRIKRVFLYPIKMLIRAFEYNAKIYHIHDPELYWTVFPLRLLNKTVILDLHEDLPSQILGKHYLNKYVRYIVSKCAKLYEGVVFPFANALVTATPHIAKVNSKFNSKIVCISNYPIKSEFNNKAKVYNESLENAVCYTGGITSIRGVDILIDCVLDSNDDWLLHLAGPINEDRMRDKLNEALKLTDRIKYWGNVDRVVLSEIFQQSKAGLVTFLPAPNHVNAVPNKMFEYMSSGLPIICSNFTEWFNITNEFNVGIAVDPQSKADLIKSIKFMFDNPEKAKSWGENGAKAVENTFNWESESLKLIALYKDLI